MAKTQYKYRRLSQLYDLARPLKIFAVPNVTFANLINVVLLTIIIMVVNVIITTAASVATMTTTTIPVTISKEQATVDSLFKPYDKNPSNENDLIDKRKQINQKTRPTQIRKRYDGTQLWRIHNIQQKHDQMSEQSLALVMENKYGGNIWKNNLEYLDISIDADQLFPAQTYLKQFHLEPEVLHTNIQNLIDNEYRYLVNSTQNQFNGRKKKEASNGLQWNGYYDTITIYEFMRDLRLKYPKICRLYTIGKTAEGRNLKVLRISENPRDYKKIWIDGGIHAREWVSPSTVTYILNTLLTQWNNLPEYMTNKTWYIMPVMNPDGYEYSRTTNRLWRKNRSRSQNPICFGVDLNRNFDIGWHGKGASDDPCSDIYRGRKPASELETDAVVKFLSKRKYNLESYLTFHSYGQLIVYPWAYKPLKVKDASDLHGVAVLAAQAIKNKTNERYRAAVTHEVLGIAGGGSDDWARSALATKYVYTIELRDRGYYGFDLPPEKILITAIEGYTIAETIAKVIY